MTLNSRLLPLFVASLWLTSVPITFAAEEIPNYERDVRPIFVRYCWSCHSPEGERIENDMDLSTLAGVLRGGKEGAAVIPGNAQDSTLVIQIEWRDDPRMPPAKQQVRVDPKEIAIIRKWIDAGAQADSLAPEPAIDALERIKIAFGISKPGSAPDPEQNRAASAAREVGRDSLTGTAFDERQIARANVARCVVGDQVVSDFVETTHDETVLPDWPTRQRARGLRRCCPDRVCATMNI